MAAAQHKPTAGSVCLEPITALLSNYEVYTIVSAVTNGTWSLAGGSSAQPAPAGSASAQPTHIQALHTIAYEVRQYLAETPCHVQNKQSIEAFVKAVQPFQLTKGEILQLINLRPATLPAMTPLVEEIEERLTEDRINQLLELIQQLLPEPPTDAMEME
ncbi:hypothetical protein CAOG_04367 [Capsaspora owczarzaki ATCC 30864]|uniref:DNA-directed RNA polymerase III subunit RPC9 n=1 Tax=Capsaspora owczarzaki (strain ATCC 30864) TaxID=595528 RepID=A0A0D2WQ09_CAPO3|nr:hypothetical protein CAOG_04367 [Capsaspora owczarzaki ATCC 30864]KJE93605.1 hypothetical protein CAOG_004367 [Capsaspora owczarzaki ATCC 30864]|eukprot:XP_004348195.1 hypothetical protein CAOG_04367 [Capsaspora owczarzaki ATCC 30864]